MGVRGEIFSTKVLLPNRTYFFNVKENRMGAQRRTAWSGVDDKFNMAWRTKKFYKMSNARRLQPEQRARGIILSSVTKERSE